METAMDRLNKQRKFRMEAGFSILRYFVINAFLVIVNWFTSPNYWWALWVISGWGVGLILNLTSAYIRSQTEE